MWKFCESVEVPQQFHKPVLCFNWKPTSERHEYICTLGRSPSRFGPKRSRPIEFFARDGWDGAKKWTHSWRLVLRVCVSPRMHEPTEAHIWDRTSDSFTISSPVSLTRTDIACTCCYFYCPWFLAHFVSVPLENSFELKCFENVIVLFHYFNGLHSIHSRSLPPATQLPQGSP